MLAPCVSMRVHDMDLWDLVSFLHEFNPINTHLSRIEVYASDNCKIALWWRRPDLHHQFFLVAEHKKCGDQESYRLYPSCVNIAPLATLVEFLETRGWKLPPIVFVYNGAHVVTRLGSKEFVTQSVRLTRDGRVYVKRPVA